MDPVACFPEERKIVSVVGSELVENYTVYIIEVRDGDHKWTVKHRYSDFHDLHQKLTAEKKVDKQLLPPKKMLGKNSKSLVEKRQKELDVYLHTLLSQFTTVTPKALSCFLHFNLYEVNGVTAALAEELFHRGDQLLLAGEVFTLRPLQLYSVTQQLRQAKPTCCTGDAKTDLGHILDFTCRLRYLKISGSKGPIGSSNIQENNLPFDLSVFKSLIHIEISECCWQQITGLPSLRSNLATLSIHNSTDNMMSILVPEAAEFSQWEVEGVESQCPVTAIIPVWEQLTTVDMSHNVISEIDGSVKVIPKVEFLDLSHNQLCSVDNLQLLYNLIHLDVSYNRMCVLESVHTRLGNIKTLNLAGNQLVTLSGLTKLYSLVNLDLSYNQLTQLEEVRHIGSLPCLERLSLNNNPVCIDPDYRTKVLAQFCDRAAEVCLDGTSTTEKELDTVEVLKAIQRARETRERRNNTEPTISEETRLSAAAPPPPPHLSPSCFSSSAVTPPPPAVTSSPCSLPTPPPPPCVAQPAATQERERKLKEEVEGEKERIKKTKHKEVNMGQEELFSPPIMQTPPPPTTNTQHLTQKPAVCLSSCHTSTHQHIHTSEPVDGSIVNSCPLLLSHLLSLSSSNKDFITQLSQRLQGSTLQEKEDKQRRKEVEVEERRCESGGEETEVLAPSNRSGPGYFEMGLDDCHSKVEVPSSSPPQQQGLEVSRVVWCHCVRVEKTLRQMEACLVLTDSLLGLFYVSTDLTSTTHDTAEEQVQRQEEVVGLLQRDLLLPYSHVLLLSSSCSDLLPASCLVLGHSSSSTRWFLFSDVQSITDTTALLSAQLNLPSEPHPTPPPLLRPLLTSWEVEENQSPQGGYPAFLLSSSSSSSSSEPSPFLSDLLGQAAGGEETTAGSAPVLLFLTQRHLLVMKVNWRWLAERERSEAEVLDSSCCRLLRVPLGSVAMYPTRPSAPPAGQQRLDHVLEVLLGQWRLLLVFPLAQDRLLFLGQLRERRDSLSGLKTLVLPRTTRAALKPGQSRGRELTGHCCLCVTPPNPASFTYSVSQQPPVQSISSLLQSLGEENQPPPHLALNLSPGLKLLAGLGGQDLLEYFHNNIAQTEGEEVRQVLWLSVVLYKSPEAELTSCLLLSTNAIYFLLEDSASSLTHHSLWETADSACRDPEAESCYYLTIRLADLLSVNVGLFDQYFRVVGSSADQIVCCLSRDSFGTHGFLQQLMAVLSLQEKVPQPESTEQDFYSHKDTGKMKNYELVHGGRVRFIYPSDEEMGDLTFIVAERKTAASSSSSSFNILLYLLAFQVQTPGSPTATGPSPNPLLEPRTLILTSTDIFLLDEDYVSYPLPDLAKEPPSREKYQVREWRRIRDLDRVLLGYQPVPQALTLVFDDWSGPDLLCHLTMDHFNQETTATAGGGAAAAGGGAAGAVGGGAVGEVQWCILVPGAESRERLLSLLARQWEALCSRELPVELTG